MASNVCVVIGSNGFTGSQFVEALLDDPALTVVGISRSPQPSALYLPYAGRERGRFEFYHVDIVRQPAQLQTLLDELEPSTVVHVAALSEVALSLTSPVEYFQTNTTAVVQLCNFLRTRPYLTRYLHISSAEVYGSCSGPVAESAPFRPSTPYAVSKAAADLYLATLASHCKFPVITVRSTNVYGKHQQLFKIIPRTVIAVRQGRKVPLHGGGRAIKSFVHVRDAVRGGLLALRQGAPGSVYHFSTPDDRTIADVVRRTGELMGRGFDEVAEPVGERPAQDARYWLDCSKAQRELGWTPQVVFDDGVREVVDWIDGHWEQVAQEPMQYVHKVPA